MDMPQKDRIYNRKEVVEIIRSVLGSLDKETEATINLHKGLMELAAYIESVREELAQMRSVEISSIHIPTALDELDAVVDEMALATGTIMDSCEKIEKAAGEASPPESAALSDNVTKIYETCGFQDITGQRIFKVVKTLKHIEVKVLEIIKALGIETHDVKVLTEDDEKSLLHGPQLKGAATSQDEIDKLLASFDK